SFGARSVSSSLYDCVNNSGACQLAPFGRSVHDRRAALVLPRRMGTSVYIRPRFSSDFRRFGCGDMVATPVGEPEAESDPLQLGRRPRRSVVGARLIASNFAGVKPVIRDTTHGAF